MSNINIHTGIFGEEAFNVIVDACDTASQIKIFGFSIDEYNEVVYYVYNTLSAAEFMKALIRRMKWFRRFEANYMTTSYVKSSAKERYAERLKKIDCIIDLLEKEKSPDQMLKKHGELYTKFGPCAKVDPIKAETIKLLRDEMSRICVKYSKDVAEYTNAAYAKRDAEVAEIQRRINALMQP